MNSIIELINKLEINKTDFSREAGIPYRTIQDWAIGNRKPTEYLINLLNYRFGKTIYTSAEYRIYGLKKESVTTKKIEEIKSLLKEENLSNADLITKYTNQKNKIRIEYDYWIVKKNLIGDFKYTIYINNGQSAGVNTNNLKDAIQIADQHALIF